MIWNRQLYNYWLIDCFTENDSWILHLDTECWHSVNTAFSNSIQTSRSLQYLLARCRWLKEERLFLFGLHWDRTQDGERCMERLDQKCDSSLWWNTTTLYISTCTYIGFLQVLQNISMTKKRAKRYRELRNSSKNIYIRAFKQAFLNCWEGLGTSTQLSGPQENKNMASSPGKNTGSGRQSTFAFRLINPELFIKPVSTLRNITFNYLM